MPLVVPGIQNTTGGDKNEWLNKLVGKKITESTHDVEVYDAPGYISGFYILTSIILVVRQNRSPQVSPDSSTRLAHDFRL